MSALQQKFEAAIHSVDASSILLHNIVHGTYTETIETENGPIKTVAKAIYDIEYTINESGNGWLAQAQSHSNSAESARDIAIGARDIAIGARDEAEIARDEAVAIALDGQDALFWPFVQSIAEQDLINWKERLKIEAIESKHRDLVAVVEGLRGSTDQALLSNSNRISNASASISSIQGDLIQVDNEIAFTNNRIDIVITEIESDIDPIPHIEYNLQLATEINTRVVALEAAASIPPAPEPTPTPPLTPIPRWDDNGGGGGGP